MKNRGFTLLELLVVIGIIGVIMALATVAYSSTQVSGRNARRKQDIIAIQNALEQYYSANSFSYPSGSCKAATTHMKSAWPVDPDTDVDYSGVGSCTTTTYCICAAMEGVGTTTGNSGASCSWTTTKDYFCVGNLQ
jgi:prepilin-type N-terminal cleavage/methylation domain-containing protein